MNNVLVTGGSGFIGSNFIRLLLAERADIRLVNADLLTYAANPANLGACALDPRYSFTRADIRDAAAMGDLFAANDFDTVFHFAAESHVDRSIASAADFVSTNVNGTQALLDAARRCWPAGGAGRRFIHISTDEVYGAGKASGLFTEDAPLNPGNPYAASKAAGELLARAWFRTYGLPVIICRPANNYGPRQHEEKLIPRLISRALQGESLPLYGQGGQLREWLYVEDNCRALLLLAEQGLPGGSYNIGSGEEQRNIEVARAVLSRLGLPESRIAFIAERPGHDFRYGLDSGKLRRLGWSPRIDFAAGLGLTLDYYRQFYPQ